MPLIGEVLNSADVLPLMEAYAARCGADFQIVRQFPEQETVYGGCVYFITVEILRRFAEQDYYDELLLLDGDVLVSPLAPNVFEEAGDYEAALVQDHFIPTREGHFKEWLLANVGSLDGHQPERPYWNAGVILIKRSAARRLNFSGPYPDCPWHDQDWLNWRLGQAGLKVTRLDERWNKRVFGKREEEIASGYFLHFCGEAKAMIADYRRRLDCLGDTNWHPGRGNETFLILTRRPCDQTRNLARLLGGFGQVVVVSDEGGAGTVSYSREKMGGFELLGYCGLQEKAVTAWEKAWKYLDETVGQQSGPVWFVEDDVAGDLASWEHLVAQSAEVGADLSTCDFTSGEDDPHWPHWWSGAQFFHSPAHSFNPLCRLSERLVMAVLEFRRNHNRFCYLEILFASLVRAHGMSFLDWKADGELSRLFGRFRFRPEVEEVEPGISHPVKDAARHTAICGQLLGEVEVGGLR